MARVENTKMTVSLDTESKRIIRHLTRAVDRLARSVMPHKADGGVTRLMEPAEDLEPGEGQRNICGNDGNVVDCKGCA